MSTRSKSYSAPSFEDVMALASPDGDSPRALADAAELSFARVDKALLIPIERIAPMKDNPRQRFDRLDELAESIQDRGLIQPLVVRRDPERPGYYMTIAGARRLLAANILRGHDNADVRSSVALLPCIVADESDDSALASALAENLARDDLTRAEAMDAMLRLEQQYSWSARQIARRTGRSKSDVAELLQLAKDPDLSDLVKQEVIAPTAAGQISGLPPLERAEAVSEIRAGRIRTVAHARAFKSQRLRAKPPKETRADDAVYSKVSDIGHFTINTDTRPSSSITGATATDKPPGKAAVTAVPATSEDERGTADLTIAATRRPRPLNGQRRDSFDEEVRRVEAESDALRTSLETHPLLATEPRVAANLMLIYELAARVLADPKPKQLAEIQWAQGTATLLAQAVRLFVERLGDLEQDREIRGKLDEIRLCLEGLRE